MSPRERMWETVYNAAGVYYGNIDGYEDWDAKLTADAAARGWYNGSSWRGYRRRNRNGLSRLPAPGKLVNLTQGRQRGYLPQIDWVLSDGTITGVEFEESEALQVYWSKRLQAIIILPYLRLGACTTRVPEAEDQIVRTWTQGRRGAAEICPATYNRPALPYAAPAIQISYISDKFSDNGKLTPYVHHFGPDVVFYASVNPSGKTRAPEAIMIRGGRLSLKSHGIDG